MRPIAVRQALDDCFKALALEPDLKDIHTAFAGILTRQDLRGGDRLLQPPGEGRTSRNIRIPATRDCLISPHTTLISMRQG